MPAISQNEESTKSLSGQTAVITGASSGIGAAVAQELRAAGMRLVLTARREDRLRQLAERLGQCIVLPGDMAAPDLPDRLIGAAVKEFGRCDVVFNGAGSMHAGPIEKIDIDQICEMLRVNVEAATRMAYTAMKHFKQVGSGHLINVSSVLGTKVRETTGAYAASKFAIEALSQALRMEVAKTDVKVSVIQPGVVVTELQDHFPVHPCQALGIASPLQPADIARCVRFLLEQPAHVRIPSMMILPGEQAM